MAFRARKVFGSFEKRTPEPKTGAGSGNFSCEWERKFVFSYGWDAKLVRETERDTGFQFQRDFSS